MKRHSQHGVALIVTLILLAVVTVMAVAFLAVSRRERSAVTTTTDTASARLAADAALANAEAQILASVLSSTNPYSFSLVVSTNYINPFGFVAGNANPTNVNYDFRSDGNSLTADQLQQNIANLLYSPRAPVFIQTNSANPNAPLDFRFYLDLNRNGRFETNGLVQEFDNNNNLVGQTLTEVGDPEWIGVLEHPDQPHGPNNRFVARYAFVAVPVGNALDLNAIHNQADSDVPAGTSRIVNPPTAGDTFMRNQGVGPWEINLAAFLADLNTNEWDPPTIENAANNPYQYNPPPLIAGNEGVAFEDARALLAYRYANNFISLTNADALFFDAPFFQNDNIDEYSDGPLQLTTSNLNEIIQPDVTAFAWSGADNTNHFFDMQDLFDTSKTAVGVAAGVTNFSDRLVAAGNGNSTYDRYTFYRLLAQLGTDSAPEQNKINLNYSNAVALFDNNGIATNITVIPGAETNLVPWIPIQFFTIAADRMLRAYSAEWLARDPSNYVATYRVSNAFGITNIPVSIGGTNVYSSAINRVLQLAANIYDATTNKTFLFGRDYPSVFRPIFRNDGTNIFIAGYEQITSVGSPADFTAAPLDPPIDIANVPLGISIENVYGVPWIIGARKGFPNFNEFSMEDVLRVTRKVEVTRPSLDADTSLYKTNQMYIFNINNSLGVECWNSYGSNYVAATPPGLLQIFVRDSLAMTLTNFDHPESSVSFFPSPFFVGGVTNFTTWSNTLRSFAPLQWPTFSQPNPNSFIIPLNTNVFLLTNGVYVYGPPSQFIPTIQDPTNYLDLGIQPLPHLGLFTTNRLQVVILDGTHVIDYVQLDGPNSARTNLNAEIADPDADGETNYLWSTNFPVNGPPMPYGVVNQIAVSRNTVTAPIPSVDDPSDNPLLSDEAPHFDAFFESNHVSSGVSNLDLQAQAPFTPTRTIIEYISLQANDPLVHSLAGDMNFSGGFGDFHTGVQQWNSNTNIPSGNIGQLNARYQPWSRSLAATNSVAPFNLAVKDPLIYYSDDWDFPTNKFPTVGWLGRVHRGTPWQTVDMKSSLPDINTWMSWSDNLLNPFDANNASPGEDRLLFDIFTTALNDNASRGQLSVNVGGTNNIDLAAWSALFSGVTVLSNSAPSALNRSLIFPRPGLTTLATNIQPAGVAGTNSVLGSIVTSINLTRASTNLFPLQAFSHAGDVLATPQLTVLSPFLNTNITQLTNGINDEVYEWLPQQVMSLLRVSGTPESPMHYVIYCYGQTLKPAPNGIVTSGSLFGLCTNYQVVAETATRAVVRFNSRRVNNVFQVGDGLGNLIWTNVPSVTNNNAVIESFNVLPPD